MFGLYMRRILRSQFFVVGVIINVVLFFIGDNYEILNAAELNMSVLDIFKFSASFGIGHVSAYILYSLPFLFYFSEEINNKMVYYRLIRCGRRSYFAGHIFSAVVSVFLMCFISIVIFTVICCMFGADFSVSKNSYDLYVSTVFGGLIKNNNVVILYCITCVSYILSIVPGILFAIVASLFIKNRYIIMAVPFIALRLFQLISTITRQEYVDWGIYTDLSAATMYKTVGGLVYAFGYQAFLLITLSVIYYVGSVRRFRNGKI